MHQNKMLPVKSLFPQQPTGLLLRLSLICNVCQACAAKCIMATSVFDVMVHRNDGIMFTCKVIMYFLSALYMLIPYFLSFFLFDSPLPLLLLTYWAWEVLRRPAQVRPLLLHLIVCLWMFLLTHHCQLLLSLQGKKITFLGRLLMLKGGCEIRLHRLVY